MSLIRSQTSKKYLFFRVWGPCTFAAMGVDEMLSLFAGFIIATFLIWGTWVCSRCEQTGTHHKQKPEQKTNSQCKRSEEKNHSWNVSTFFHLVR